MSFCKFRIDDCKREIEKKERSMINEMKEESNSREEIMMNEIEIKFKSREEAMVNEMESSKKAMMSKIERMSDVEDALFRKLKESKEKSQSELRMLQLELMVVTLACVGISFVAYISFRQK